MRTQPHAFAVALALVAAAVTAPPARATAPMVNEENVSRAIEQGVQHLYSQATLSGIWDTDAPPRVAVEHDNFRDKDYLWGGKTSLVLCALAVAGQEQDPRFQKALGWLMKQELWGTYGVGLRMQLIHTLQAAQNYQGVLKRDGAYLLKGAKAGGGGAMWSYTAAPFTYFGTNCPGDYSNTNYAVLGLWAAGDEKLEVERSVWLQIEKAWVLGQQKTGGWSYFPVTDLTRSTPAYWSAQSGSMAAAAIASLHLVIDQCYAGQKELGAFRNTFAYKSIQAGLKWMETGFSAKANPGRPEWTSYYFYNCERVAAAAGLKYFGRHDWFREIAATILAAQQEDGSFKLGTPSSYGPLVDTAYSLMFLAKGSAPIVFNKLQHAGDWDNRLRDLAHLTEWLARQSERPANWQVVGIKAPPEEWTDSRILYVAGAKKLSFADADKAALRRYVELGGLLVFQADSPDPNFAASARQAFSEMWPDLETRPADLTQPPFVNAFRPLMDMKKLPRVEVLASPSRVFAFLLLDSPAAAWERREYVSKKEQFELGASLHRYATDMAPLKDLPTKLTFFAEPFLPLPEERGRWGAATQTAGTADSNTAGANASSIIPRPPGRSSEVNRALELANQLSRSTTAGRTDANRPSAAGADANRADANSVASLPATGPASASAPTAASSPAGTITLARIRYGDVPHRWNPEPLAFERFARVLAARQGVRIEIRTVKPAELATCGAKFAHLAGVDDLRLSGEEANAIADFVKGGGTLLAEQAGGPPRNPRQPSFEQGLRKWADASFGEGSLKPMPPDSALLTDIPKVLYRNVDGVRRQRKPLILEHVSLAGGPSAGGPIAGDPNTSSPSASGPEISGRSIGPSDVRGGGRSGVIYCPFDLGSGLLDCPNPMAAGLAPECAYELLTRLLTGKTPTTQP